MAKNGHWRRFCERLLEVSKKKTNTLFCITAINTQESRNMIEKAEERFNFSDEEDSEEEKVKEIAHVNSIRRERNLKCKLCDSENEFNKHEAQNCTISACIFCGSSFHKLINCNIVAGGRKMNMFCKLCSSSSHTIDLFPEK